MLAVQLAWLEAGMSSSVQVLSLPVAHLRGVERLTSNEGLT